jgi:nuclear GTP-binding protein
LRTQCPTLMFRSATAFLPEGATTSMQDPLSKKIRDKGKAKVSNDDALGAESVLNCLSHWPGRKKPLNVAVIGVANHVRLLADCFFFFILHEVGKSSLINSLLKRAALPIYLFVQRAVYN